MTDKHRGSRQHYPNLIGKAMPNTLEEVYVIMYLSEVFESGYYTNEEKVSERVESLNDTTKSERFWYKRLFKVTA